MKFKRMISLIIAAAMLFCAAPAVISGEDGDPPASLALDPCAPAKIADDTYVVIDKAVSAAEIASYFEDSDSVSVFDAEGEAAQRADALSTGAAVSVGGETLTVCVVGDVNGDAKLNARDVIAAMCSSLGSCEFPKAAADVNEDGSVNSRDVISIMRRIVGYSESFGEDARYAESGDADVCVYFDSLMHRVSSEDTAVHGSTAGVYHMAKSEIEDAQFFIVSKKQIQNVTVEIGALQNADGDTLDVTVLDQYSWGTPVFTKILTGKVFQSPLEGGRFGEALPKLISAIDLQANESRGLVFQVKTTADSVSGWYSAPVTLRGEDGAVVKEAVLRMYVWDFTLDETPATETAFGFSFDGALTAVAREEAKKTDRDVQEVLNDQAFRDANRDNVIESYMQLFLDSRISPYHLPYAITDPRCDEIMSNPRITSFCVDGGGNYHEQLKTEIAKGSWITSDSSLLADYRKLAQNEEWLHKAYIYYVDEPSTLNVYLSRVVREHMDALFDSTDDLKGIEWHQVVPMGGNDVFTDEFGTKTDESEYVYRYVDIMIPQTYAFGTYYSNSERIEAKKKGIELFPAGAMVNRWIGAEHWKLYPEQWQQRYDRYADEQGMRRWWYICCSPELPYANFFTYYQGAPQRVVLWQQYMFHSEGLLYWATQDKWEKTNLKSFPTNGDGVLLYWGEMWGQSGPVTSIRWEYIRDGIEDFQYFSQLERTGIDRGEIVSKYINRATTAILEFSEDPYLYEATRTEIGFELEAAEKAE